jgi:hypothetical protein
MNSIWFSVDDEDYETDINDSSSDESGTFMGVFNQRPEDIAKRLPRPPTPFQPPSRFQPKFQDSYYVSNISTSNSQPEALKSLSDLGSRTTALFVF